MAQWLTGCAEGVMGQQDPVDRVCSELVDEAVLARNAGLTVGFDFVAFQSDLAEQAAADGAGKGFEDGRAAGCDAVVGHVTGHQAGGSDAGVASHLYAGQDLGTPTDTAVGHQLGVAAFGVGLVQSDHAAGTDDTALADGQRTDQGGEGVHGHGGLDVHRPDSANELPDMYIGAND